MTESTQPQFGLFSFVIVFVALQILLLYARIFVYPGQYPIFTTEEQITAAQKATFGVLAHRL
jgi:hypothetical protein